MHQSRLFRKNRNNWENQNGNNFIKKAKRNKYKPKIKFKKRKKNRKKNFINNALLSLKY
jgi:hypothetical protein